MPEKPFAGNIKDFEIEKIQERELRALYHNFSSDYSCILCSALAHFLTSALKIFPPKNLYFLKKKPPHFLAAALKNFS